MEKRRSRRLAAGTALFILLLLAAMTGALASDYGMVSDTVMWQLDDSGVITITGNGKIPDYARGEAPWSQYKNRITEVLFYGDITRIGSYSFSDCTKITHVAFPGTLKRVGKGAFSGCKALASSDTAAESWTVPSYEWSEDYSTLTATRTSNLDASVIQTETVRSTRETTAEATCREAGSEKYTADGFKNPAFKGQTITVVIPAGHNPVTDAAVEPTCTETGLTEGSHCSVCGEVITEQTVIPVKGHTMDYVAAADSSCTEHGRTEHWHCSVCGKDFLDEQGETEINAELPLEAHTLTAYEAKEPVCKTSEPGNKAYWQCTGCGHYFLDENGEQEADWDEIVLQPVHKLREWLKMEPTCVKMGMEPFWDCTVCNRIFSDASGADEYELQALPALDPLGHDMDHRTVRAATCTEAGYTVEYWYCTRCLTAYADERGYSPIDKPEDIAPLGHAWEEPTYTWSEDRGTCTAERICRRNPEDIHRETENGQITVRTTPATPEKEGKTVYTATFTNPAFAPQTTEVPIPKTEPVKPSAGSYTDKATGTYDIKADGTAVFKKPAKSKSTVTVPDTITVKGYPVKVTAIADKAFSKDKKLTTVTIGKNVRTIGKNAFNGCEKLKTVKGGSAVEAIRDSAFSGCGKLKTLPSFAKLKTIGANAFKGCKALTKITVGTKVNAIGKNAFSGCAKLKTITIKSTLLTKKNVKNGAFKGIDPKATVKCPKKKLEDYRKFLPGKGVPKTATIK